MADLFQLWDQQDAGQISSKKLLQLSSHFVPLLSAS